MSIGSAIVIAVVCLAFEAFFSGSEIAMVSADRALLRRKANQGSTAAVWVQWFLDRPQRLLATTLLGTNLSLVTSSTVITLTVLSRFPHRGELVTVAILSPVVLILGEIVPKTLFQQHADKIVTRVVFPLRLAALVFTPFVYFLQRFSSFAARMLNVEGRTALVTREELLLLLQSAKHRGDKAITEGERAMISNVLEFRGTTVDTVMVPLSEVTALPEDASLAEAAREISDKQHTRIPLYRDRIDQITGVLHSFDVLAALARGQQRQLSELARAPVYAPESQPAVDLLLELQRRGQQLAVVVDEYGGATGVCTVEDILEEIVGEIDDEYDRGPSPIRLESPGVYRVTARTSIAVVNRELGLALPETDDYVSIAGLLLDRLKRIPRSRDAVRVGDVTLLVTSASERAVDEVQIRIGKRR